MGKVKFEQFVNCHPLQESDMKFDNKDTNLDFHILLKFIQLKLIYKYLLRDIAIKIKRTK